MAALSASLVTPAISVTSMIDESEDDSEDEPLICRVVSGSETSRRMTVRLRTRTMLRRRILRQ